jgi:integrase
MATNLSVQTVFLIDLRRKKVNGLYPVKLRVTHQRKQVYYTLQKLEPIIDQLNKDNDGKIKHLKTIQDFSAKDWESIKGEKPRGKFKDIANELNAIESKFNDIINKVAVFSFDALEKQLKNSTDKNNVFDVYKNEIQAYYDNGQAGTGSNYECSLNSLKKYAKTDALKFSDVTPDWLNKYENWMTDDGKSSSTVGIYLRPLRALFNKSDVKNYPFSRKKDDGGFIIPGSENTKKALKNDELKKLFEYEPMNLFEQRSLDYWKFSFLSKGMNFFDIAKLKFSDFDNDSFSFVRQKTARSTKKKQIKINVLLHPDAKLILQRQANKMNDPDAYVFPIFNPGMTAREQRAKLNSFISAMNQNIKSIALKIGITEKISFYFARHTFATRLMDQKFSVEFISKSLGHGNVKTTENYLGSFEQDSEREALNHLTNF